MNGHMAIELTSSPSWTLSNGGNPFCLTCRFDLCCPSTSARGRTQGQASTCALTPAPASIKQASQRPCLPCRRVHKPTSRQPAYGSPSAAAEAWLGWQYRAEEAEARACGRNRRAGSGASACRPFTWDRGDTRFHALAPGIFVPSPT
jgi:hypothetical protein